MSNPFAVVYPNAHIRHLNGRLGGLGIGISGPIARTRHGLVARWFEGSATCWALIPADRTIYPVGERPPYDSVGQYDLVADLLVARSDPAGEIRSALGGGGFAPFALDDAADIELAEFARRHPAVAEAAGVIAPKRSRLFGPGTIRIPVFPANADVAWHQIDWRKYLSMHCDGFYGEHGQQDHAPVSDGEAFAAGLEPTSTFNRLSIQSNYGPVRSRFVLPDSIQALRDRSQRSSLLAGEVLSQLGGTTITLCKLGSIPA